MWDNLISSVRLEKGAQTLQKLQLTSTSLECSGPRQIGLACLTGMEPNHDARSKQCNVQLLLQSAYIYISTGQVKTRTGWVLYRFGDDRLLIKDGLPCRATYLGTGLVAGWNRVSTGWVLVRTGSLLVRNLVGTRPVRYQFGEFSRVHTGMVPGQFRTNSVTLARDWYRDGSGTVLNKAVRSGFSVNLQVILANPKAVFKRRGSQPGMQESDFLKQITKVEELEPKAQSCTKVLVWHTRTEKVNLGNETKHHQDTIQIEV
ncbi:UNVERIFIED_CONTAM: hypothetical protein FKN15_006401 [Acipenser sinensis]